jgi:hypothetical protein
MGRLFCFGDSFVDWDIPKYHWTYYLSKHYEVIKHGKFGADNYSILFQLGRLPEFNEGDRIIVVFTEPGRLPRRFYGKRKEGFSLTKYMSPRYYEDKKFGEQLHELKGLEGLRWLDGERDDEVNFYRNLKGWLSKYQPIFLTWNESFYEKTNDFVSLIDVTTNYDEGVGETRDFHPGPQGCYEIYKKLHEDLYIREDIVPFQPHEKNVI